MKLTVVFDVKDTEYHKLANHLLGDCGAQRIENTDACEERDRLARRLNSINEFLKDWLKFGDVT